MLGMPDMFASIAVCQACKHMQTANIIANIPAKFDRDMLIYIMIVRRTRPSSSYFLYLVKYKSLVTRSK